jgi:hypothetical protein
MEADAKPREAGSILEIMLNLKMNLKVNRKLGDPNTGMNGQKAVCIGEMREADSEERRMLCPMTVAALGARRDPGLGEFWGEQLMLSDRHL